ncbi:MAG: hypothetical protein ACFCBU_11210, partial [Cyanophyceae cyanobacterium]
HDGTQKGGIASPESPAKENPPATENSESVDASGAALEKVAAAPEAEPKQEGSAEKPVGKKTIDLTAATPKIVS